MLKLNAAEVVFLIGIVAVGTSSLFKLNNKNVEVEGKKFRGRVEHVVDGTNFYLSNIAGQIRLWGVDAPGKNEKGYSQAQDILYRLVYNKLLICREVQSDLYDKTMAKCTNVEGLEINTRMIELIREYQNDQR